jgi:hypothetical protein
MPRLPQPPGVPLWDQYASSGGYTQAHRAQRPSSAHKHLSHIEMHVKGKLRSKAHSSTAASVSSRSYVLAIRAFTQHTVVAALS